MSFYGPSHLKPVVIMFLKRFKLTRAEISILRIPLKATGDSAESDRVRSFAKSD